MLGTFAAANRDLVSKDIDEDQDEKDDDDGRDDDGSGAGARVLIDTASFGLFFLALSLLLSLLLGLFFGAFRLESAETLR